MILLGGYISWIKLLRDVEWWVVNFARPCCLVGTWEVSVQPPAPGTGKVWLVASCVLASSCRAVWLYSMLLYGVSEVMSCCCCFCVCVVCYCTAKALSPCRNRSCWVMFGWRISVTACNDATCYKPYAYTYAQSHGVFATGAARQKCGWLACFLRFLCTVVTTVFTRL